MALAIGASGLLALVSYLSLMRNSAATAQAVSSEPESGR
jgi:hypothetical protein